MGLIMEDDDRLDDEAGKSEQLQLTTQAAETVLPNTAQSRWEAIARKEFDSGKTAYTSPSGSVMVTFTSPEVHRLQLRARASERWFPRTVVAGLETAFEFLIRLMSSCPALAVALDASSLCHIGQAYEDQRLLRAGQSYYNNALHLLRRELSSPADRRNKGLIGAITVLQITERFTSMATGDSWIQHSHGMTALLGNIECNGDRTYGYQQHLAANFYMFHFWAGLAARKHIICFGTFGGPDGGTVLASIVERIPGVLEMVDNACCQTGWLLEHQGREILHTLQRIENELKAWSLSWNPCMRSSPFHVVDSNTLFTYPSNSRKQSRNPFPWSMDFANVHDALDHCMCTASLLSVKSAMIQVHAALAKDETERQASRRTIDALTASATTCAGSLCMALPFLFKPEFGLYGYVIAGGPLRVAKEWFESQQRNGSRSIKEMLRWCREAGKRLEEHGIRPL